MNRRTPVTWIAPALLGAALAGCTFSSGGSTEVSESGQDALAAQSSQAPRRAADQDRPIPHVSKLCDDLVAVYLTNISDAENAGSIVDDWVRVTAAAPASLKGDLNIVGAYLVAASQGNYAVLKNASDVVDEALDHVDRYVTKVCRAPGSR